MSSPRGGCNANRRRAGQEAYRQLGGEKELVVVPGATHLFEEPGALDEVARHASSWFARHLAQPDVEHAGKQGVVVL